MAIASLLSMTNCKTDFDTDVADIKPAAGEADFSNYVALGNSLTSGYRDGALTLEGQLESYPLMIAEQMKTAGGRDFTQPLMQDNNGGLVLGGTQIQSPKVYIKGIENGAPVIERINNGKSTHNLDILAGKGTYNNMGVPGAKVAHLLAPNYGDINGVGRTANPYFVRFASSPNTSVIADFIAKKPTFFSLWIGNNDALLYAMNGADETQSDALTPASEFGIYYNILATQIKTTNAKGVIANIPNVTSVPALTTVPYNPITATILGKGNSTAGEALIDQLNAQVYGPLKQILTALGAGDRIQLLSKNRSNPLLIKDKDLEDLGAKITAAAIASGNPQLQALASYLGATYGQARQAQAGDLVPITTRAEIGEIKQGLPLPAPLASLGAQGVAYPLEDKFILTKEEADKINKTIAKYNQTIKGVADRNGWAFVDANAKMKELSQKSGLTFNAVNYTAAFVTGGAFSLDGVHLSGRGYAVIANEFIKAINAKYGSTLPQVNPNKYSGVKFP